MAIKISDISSYTKFINTKFIDDIKPAEEPSIDVISVMGAYTEKEKVEAANLWKRTLVRKKAAEEAAAALAAAYKKAIEAKEAFEKATAISGVPETVAKLAVVKGLEKKPTDTFFIGPSTIESVSAKEKVAKQVSEPAEVLTAVEKRKKAMAKAKKKKKVKKPKRKKRTGDRY